jgi:hypothetical protein
MDEIYAEDVNYWKTGRSSPDEWLDKTRALIASVDGVVNRQAFAAEAGGQQAYLIEFTLADQAYKIVWPVLQTKSGKDWTAAKRQAATALYHDVKARVVTLKFLGARNAFFPFLVLDNGLPAAQLGEYQFAQRLPRLLLSH